MQNNSTTIATVFVCIKIIEPGGKIKALRIERA